MKPGRATVIIVNTNERHHLERCLPSVLDQDYADFEVLVVDNASTDGSVEYVRRCFPQVRIVQNSENLGYVGANNAGFEHASGDYLVVLNPDTLVERDWLRELLHPLAARPAAGLATSRILMMDEPGLLNACGNEVTFAGITVCRGLGRPADSYPRLDRVSAVSGAAFAIKRAVLEEIGAFDDLFFIYYEDTDLSLRAALAGYDCLYVPTSVVYHDYAFRFSAWKGFLQERNRLLSWLKIFRWGTLIALLPTLLLAEVLAWGYVALQGREHLRSKVRSYAWLVQNRHTIAAARRRTQALRRVKDRQILGRLSHRLSFAETTNRYLALFLGTIVQSLLWLWGGLCRIVVVW
jgi:GT2 family glycosyltransferase